MLLALEIMGIIFMASIMFVAIWGFITLNLILGQMKYRNSLLEKLNLNIHLLGTNGSEDSNASPDTAEVEIQTENAEVKANEPEVQAESKES